MSWLSSAINAVAPVVAAYSPEPISRTVAMAKVAYDAKEEEKILRQEREEQQKAQQKRLEQMSEFDIMPTPGVRSQVINAPATQNAGFGAGFGSFLTDVGRNIINPISSIFTSPAVAPFISQQSRTQPAIPSQSLSGGQESSASGTSTAFIGGVPSVIGAARNFLRTPAGGALGGGALGLLGGMMSPTTGGRRITRKMKSQARMVVNLVGGDLSSAAGILGISESELIMVLLKRFRNDGPVVTKAALRKTKSTVRKLKNMCDMYDSLRPTATRRRAPMKRASTTLISNK